MLLVSRAQAVLSSNMMSLADADAYWIDPSGKAIGTHGSHTDSVMEMPGAFRVSKEFVEGLFAEGEEDAVLRYFLERGWVRIRYLHDRYYVSLKKLDTKRKDLVRSWALGVLNLHSDFRGRLVVLEELDTGFSRTDTLGNIADESLLTVAEVGRDLRAVVVPVFSARELWGLLPLGELRERLEDFEFQHNKGVNYLVKLMG